MTLNNRVYKIIFSAIIIIYILYYLSPREWSKQSSTKVKMTIIFYLYVYELAMDVSTRYILIIFFSLQYYTIIFEYFRFSYYFFKLIFVQQQFIYITHKLSKMCNRRIYNYCNHLWNIRKTWKYEKYKTLSSIMLR